MRAGEAVRKSRQLGARMTALKNQSNNRSTWTRARLPLFVSTIALTAGILGTGCDDKRDATPPPPSPTTAPVIPAAATRPTTAELTGGPRQTIRLSSPSLSMEIPKAWKNVTMGESTWIECYTPHGGPIRLQMTSA